MQAVGTSNKTPAHGAYLVTHESGGYCLVDQLFDPALGGPPSAEELEATWNEATHSVSISSVHAARVKHTRDGEPAGMVNAAVHELRTYRVGNGVLTPLTQSTNVLLEQR